MDGSWNGILKIFTTTWVLCHQHGCHASCVAGALSVTYQWLYMSKNGLLTTLVKNLLPPQWFPAFITVGEDPHESWSFPRHVKFASWASGTWQPPSLAECCNSEEIAIQHLVSLVNGIFVAETLKIFITPTDFLHRLIGKWKRWSV